ncbi:hypothetical protein L1887_35923 [Cichorium endivia]|nr:hypothetical protein L1887_35923 [Cichorium endivia]
MKSTSRFRFDPRDVDEIFAEFFYGSNGVSGGGGDGGRKKGNPGGVLKNSNQKSARKAETVENKLSCSLEELYKGFKRKMQILRIVLDDSGKPRIEEILPIHIKPGW